MKSKRVCRTHGGLSTGPKTADGRARCAKAKTIHGKETRALRVERRKRLSELRELETLGYAIGMFKGPRTVGRKPKI